MTTLLLSAPATTTAPANIIQDLLGLLDIRQHPDNFYNQFAPLLDALTSEVPWFKREFESIMHRAISSIIYNDTQRAFITDWRQLVIEWPHVSDTDPLRIAYTRNNADGERNRQTITTLGRYLKRHAPTMPDNLIRDIVALNTPDKIAITFELGEMLQAIQDGPRSCMQSRNWSTSDHPYNVYAPEFGWGMAIRTGQDGAINGRCLVNIANPENKHFVRSYARQDNYSESDQSIEAYLFANGYMHQSSWAEDTKLARIRAGRTFVMPYVDGRNTRVTEYEDYFKLRENGEYEACSTCGILEMSEYHCQHCNADVDEDEDYCDADGDFVCDNCLDNRYTRAISQYGEETYVRDGYYTETREGEYYDDNYLSDNGIVELEDGTYTHEDNAVYVGCECHHVDDEGDTYVTLENEYDGERYALTDDAWQCDITGNWFHNDDEDSPKYGDDTPVSIEGLAVLLNEHADNPARKEKLALLEMERDMLRARLAELTSVEAFT
jgi:hypothetical protein